MQLNGHRVLSPARRAAQSGGASVAYRATSISSDSAAYLDLLITDAKRIVCRLTEVEDARASAAAAPQHNDALRGDSGATADVVAVSQKDLQETVRLLNEAKGIMIAQLQRAEQNSALARVEKERATTIAEHLQERNAILMKELSFIRTELDDTRAALQRARQMNANGGDDPLRQASRRSKSSSSNADAVAVSRLERELTAARTLLLRNEARSLEHAADVAAALEAASANQSAALRADAIQARLEAMSAKHEAARQEWLLGKHRVEQALSDVSAKLAKTHQHRLRAQTEALKCIGQVAAMRCAGRYFATWARRRAVSDLHAQLEAAKHTNEAQAQSLREMEDDHALLKMKHHRVTTSMQELLDTRRQEIVKLTAENTSLSERLASMMRRAGHFAANASSTMTAENTPIAPSSPTSAFGASPAASADRRGGDGQAASESQQIEALEMYNLLYRVLKACKQRLNFTCVPVAPIQMHVNTTASVTTLVTQWARNTAMGFSKLFALESRITKLRTRLVCCSVGTRGKIAAVAIKLSLPVGTLEEQVLRTKKERYEELITRIASLRAKVESTRANVYANFNVKDTRSAAEVVDALERDVTAFLSIIRQVEVDQFQLSLRLTQARLADGKDAQPRAGSFASDGRHHQGGTADPSLPRARSVDAVRKSNVLRESQALVASLRHAGHVAPAARTSQPSAALVRHHALTPLEDFIPSGGSEGHRRMLDGSVSNSQVHPVHVASTVLRQRAKVERQAAKDPNNKKLILQSVGMSRRGGAVIPFRETPPVVGDYNTMKRVQIADDLIV